MYTIMIWTKIKTRNCYPSHIRHMYLVIPLSQYTCISGRNHIVYLSRVRKHTTFISNVRKSKQIFSTWPNAIWYNLDIYLILNRREPRIYYLYKYKYVCQICLFLQVTKIITLSSDILVLFNETANPDFTYIFI